MSKEKTHRKRKKKKRKTKRENHAVNIKKSTVVDNIYLKYI